VFLFPALHVAAWLPALCKQNKYRFFGRRGFRRGERIQNVNCYMCRQKRSKTGSGVLVEK